MARRDYASISRCDARAGGDGQSADDAGCRSYALLILLIPASPACAFPLRHTLRDRDMPRVGAIVEFQYHDLATPRLKKRSYRYWQRLSVSTGILRMPSNCTLITLLVQCRTAGVGFCKSFGVIHISARYRQLSRACPAFQM